MTSHGVKQGFSLIVNSLLPIALLLWVFWGVYHYFTLSILIGGLVGFMSGLVFAWMDMSKKGPGYGIIMILFGVTFAFWGVVIGWLCTLIW